MNDTDADVARLANALAARREMLVTAESCTGGMIAAACTDRAGSSEWFERGFVTYSNAAKTQMLGVDAGLIAAQGAVSAEVAAAMATGALDHAAGQWSVAVTGIAGPGGATPGKPVGTVWLAIAHRGSLVTVELLQLSGDRASIRAQTLRRAVQRLLHEVEHSR